MKKRPRDPNQLAKAIVGFAMRVDAIKWIRCQGVVWLYEKRKKRVG